jgi:hypothetical protein
MSQTTNIDRALASLKDFQRDTVDYVFRRMYLDAEPALRFLVADEVGLGKTLVAAGLVGRAIQHLQEVDRVDRIDVVYICSNATIARQNINRLNKTGQKNHRLPDRITLLPRDLRQLREHRVNFISFTPGTSFSLRSSGGRSEERALLYWLLPESWRANDRGTISLLRGAKNRDGFRTQVEDLRGTHTVDEGLRRAFRAALAEPASDGTAPGLQERFIRLADGLDGRTNLTDEESSEQLTLIARLRAKLAAVCIHSLEPDLVILDEFQRFTGLLDGADDASALARELFTYSNVRVLLLSATPYRMYSTADAADRDRNAHYEDLVRTVGFLLGDVQKTKAFEHALARYREAIFAVGAAGGRDALISARDEVTTILRGVMVRTERLVAQKDGMLRERPLPATRLQNGDVRGYLAMQGVARAIGHADVIEYWKSAPYLLNFMDEYDFKEDFATTLDRPEKEAVLANVLADVPETLLSRSDWLAYKRIDPANARLRGFAADVLDSGLWRLLWMPPSLPYYAPGGDFADVPAGALTKRLVFSSWQVVPKAIASWMTYEVERRMFGIPDAGLPEANAQESRKKRRGLLRFSISDGRLSGLPVLALMYPSMALAAAGDPLRLVEAGALVSSADALADAAQRLRPLLDRITAGAPTDGDVDERWFWAAPILLDLEDSPDDTRRWFGQAHLAERWRGSLESDDEASDGEGIEPRGWAEHVDMARRYADGDSAERPTLGRVPPDLLDVLAQMAVAGPAVCAARALARISGGLRELNGAPLRDAAGRVAFGLRSLFNQPEAMAIVRGPRGGEDERYWRLTLEYALRGNLQAVLDELAHVLLEDLGVSGRPACRIQRDVAAAMRDALELRTANLLADAFVLEGARLEKGAEMRFRTSFAVRFGGRQTDDSKTVRREGDLQRAFNSPFWPYVLCSTSVGQEGLDFHRYCHAVVHWNLPSNPVDLEQREGRVHRFKGHAVRKNVANDYRNSLRYQTDGLEADPWNQVFHEARQHRDPGLSDLVPFWVYGGEGGASIERYIPMLGLSKDEERSAMLKRSLAVYRMAFGQSRQDEMVEYLLRHLTPEQVDAAVREARIDLSPDPSMARELSGRMQAPGELIEETDDESLQAEPTVSWAQIEALLNAFAHAQPAPARIRSADELAAFLDAFSTLAGKTTAMEGEDAASLH